VPPRLLPEGGAEARPVELLVAAPDVVDEQVEAALFLREAGEQGFDLGVRRMVAANGDPRPPRWVTASAVSRIVPGSPSVAPPASLRPVT
jgi:hypothetical protein